MTTTAEAEDAVTTLLAWCGYDPEVDGLRDTPSRVARSLRELTEGEHTDPGDYLATVFNPDDTDADEMIVLRSIPFASLCEHHMLPFVGHATVAYIPSPGAGVVGLSKLARVVEGYARRLQVQERLTTQIARCVDKHTDNVGVAVRVTALHTCMTLRGIRKDEARMVTSALYGLFRDAPSARAEFLDLARDR